MTQEEKAKRFDEVVEEFRGLLEGVHEDKCDIMEEDILKIVPELKKSEDEKIRKALISYFKSHLTSSTEIDKEHWEGMVIKDILAWLEKQGASAWSEEDEIMLKSIIATCELAEQDRDSSPARHLFEMQANWLKSLKDRVQPKWKPSKEHIRYLQAVINDVNNIGSESCYIALRNLLEQLKKL